MLLLPRQYGYHTSWYLSRWCHLSPLTETKATCQLSTTLITVKTQGCKKRDTFKINFILIVVLMNIVYNCFSIIRDYVTAVYVINVLLENKLQTFFLTISIYCFTVRTCNGTDIFVINSLNIISNNTNYMHL